LTYSRYVVGIDLGTTNCVLSYVDTGKDQERPSAIELFQVPQVISPGEIGTETLLPSFIYLPTEPEKKDGRLTLPWDPFGDRVVGSYARKRGAEVPGRLVASAKSWLSYQRVDRTAAILPLDAAADVAKLSPIVASATLLRHLKAAWNHLVAQRTGERLEDQEIYLTIPASFDAVARELTVQAARSAGLEKVTLLEEPQAAFYAWLHTHHDDWTRMIHPGDLILVCDIGGGTTDFSLIRATSKDGELGLERAAVGEHLLLGGDNMDLALAYALGEDLKARGTELDRLQRQTLWHSTRMAKEKLLDDAALAETPVVIPGRGTGLVAGTVRTSLKKEQVESVILDGFLPVCGSNEGPRAAPRIGLQEFGLPYVSDTAATRHLAGFLGLHGRGGETEGRWGPSAILFNGGVMKSLVIRRRMLDVIGSWLEEKGAPEAQELSSADLDTAVAKGAAYYGLVRRGEGLKIRSGIAQSYYIGIETTRPAVPGMAPAMKALCLVPKGMEEGSSVSLPDRTFGLVVGQAVEFHFMAAANRPDDKLGDFIEDWEGTIEPLTTLETAMEAPEIEPGTVIPVQLEAEVTEIGTLALALVYKEKGLKFNLEFNVRG
jgi:Ethanolamine utilization protein EutJ (predicted chaperonin)